MDDTAKGTTERAMLRALTAEEAAERMAVMQSDRLISSDLFLDDEFEAYAWIAAEATSSWMFAMRSVARALEARYQGGSDKAQDIAYWGREGEQPYTTFFNDIATYLREGYAGRNVIPCCEFAELIASFVEDCAQYVAERTHGNGRVSPLMQTFLNVIDMYREDVRAHVNLSTARAEDFLYLAHATSLYPNEENSAN